MINSDTYDHAHRLRSYEIVSQVMNQINRAAVRSSGSILAAALLVFRVNC